MKKTVFALSLLSSSLAFATTTFNFHNLGFSPSGYTYAFAESAVQDGSGFPVANVYIVNVAKNKVVASEKAMIEDDSNSSEAADALSLAVEKSKTVLAKVAIRPGHNLGQEITLNKQSDKRALFSADNNSFELNLTERDANNNKDESYCHYTDSTSKMITLTLNQTDKGQEKTITLQEDKKQPKSRFCSSNYTIARAIHLGKSLVVVLSYDTPGFEGPDTNYIVITGKLP